MSTETPLLHSGPVDKAISSRRPSTTWGAVGMVLVGTLAMGVGIGVGMRWLLATGLSLPTVLGLSSLVIGVTLVTVGSLRLVRSRRGPVRWLLLPLIWVGVAVIVWTLAPAFIATVVPPTPHDRFPRDIGLEAVDVVFPTTDGVELAAWYIPSENGAAVVLRHGSGSNSEATLAHAAVLADHGFGVLMTDARGHGGSGGRAMDFGWSGSTDTSAAVTFLMTSPDVDPARIAVVGLSMGGEEAIGAIGADSRIAAVVAEGATARTEEDKRWLSDVYGWRGSLQEVLEWLQYRFTSLLSSQARPEPLRESAQAASPRPILLIVGEATVDEAHAADYIVGGADHVIVWDVPGSGHIGALVTAPVEWEARVIGFLEEALLD